MIEIVRSAKGTEVYQSTGHADIAAKITTARVTKIHTDQGDQIIEAWLGSTV